jgi:carbon-monoxide dehydrogenase medium subunit
VKRLRPFELALPASVDEAVALLAAAEGGARPLAGGTDLLVDMKLGRMRPRVLVDLKRIPGLDGIERVEGGLRIGALALVASLAASAVVEAGWRALWQAAGVLGSPPIRHLATVGGNLGRGSPASDLTPPLLVHDARIVVAGPAGEREVAMEDLHTGPGATCLAPGEIVTFVMLPDAVGPSGSAHLKLGKRGGGWDLAVAGVSASLTLGGNGVVTAARIALASVGPTVLRARHAEERLCGLKADEAGLEAAAEAAAAEARPISDVRATADYRRRLTRVLALRALLEARAEALARGGVS